MTVTKPQYEDYYSRYAPRTHGLPPPAPLHDFPRGREFYRRIGEPKKVVAPMVDQSELVRLLPLCLLTYRLGEFLLDDTERIYVIRP